MNVSSKRLFVGNLPEGVSEIDLSNEFGAYGNVLSVEIKEKKDNLSPNGTSIFAFINLEVDGFGLNKCVNEFSSQKWRGQYLKVAPAKESFMEQLKREREEAQGKKTAGTIVNSNELQKKLVESTESNNKSKIALLHNESSKKKASSKITPRVATSSSSDSSDSDADSDDYKKKKVTRNIGQKDTVLQKLEDFSDFWKDKDEDITVIPDYVIKNNKQKNIPIGKALKIDSVVSQCALPKPKQPESQIDPHILLAEQKRLKSLNEKKIHYNQQKNLVQQALSKIDSTSKNKMMFDEDGEYVTNDKNKKNSQHKTENTKGKIKPQTNDKYSLFDDDDDAEDDGKYNFEIKEQFEGEKGQKLLELQSRFTNDKRFTMDSRFLENGDENERDNVQHSTEDGDVEKERERQFQILGDVLGKTIEQKTNYNEDYNGAGKTMLRFDPSKPDHGKYLIEEKNDGKVLSKRKRKAMELEAMNESKEEPVVSKEKFYKVTNNLKESLQEKSEFSLLGLFGSTNDNDNSDKNYESKEISNKGLKHPMDLQNNPFRYDSSDTEDEDESRIETAGKDAMPITTSAGMTSKGVWRENFFFKANDQRIIDGLAFFTTPATKDNEAEPFSKVRRELKIIVRNKVRNNLRNARPFKKKLGGKKFQKGIIKC